MMMVETRRIEELRRRVRLDPASIAFAALADENLRVGRFDDAIAACALGLRRHPSYLSARLTLGRALMGAGRLDEAQTELELVRQGAPDNLAADRALAEIRARRERALLPTPSQDDPQLRALETFLSALESARAAPGGLSS